MITKKKTKNMKTILYKMMNFILSFMMIFSMMATNLNLVFAESVEVTTPSKYRYSDYGLGSNSSWYTFNYKAKIGGKQVQAVCSQPDKHRPGSGSYTVSRMATDSKAAKAMYYSWYAPKDDLYWTKHYNSQKVGARYIITHMTVARAMGENWSYMANSTAKKICTDFYNWLDNQPAIPGNNDVFFRNSGKVVDKITEPKEGNGWFERCININDFDFLLTMENHFSQAVSIRNWNENQDFEMKLPENVRAVIMENNADTYRIKRVTDFNETIRLSGDQSGKWIYGFILKKDSDAKTSTIELKGSSISSSYKAYKLKLNGSSSSKQILCALDKDGLPASTSLKINWEDDTELSISKDDEFGKPIKGAKFTIGKSTLGNLTITDVVDTITTDENGEFTIKLQPGTYYVQETSVPQPFVRDSKIKEITLENGDSKTLTFINRHQTGSLSIDKIDDWTEEHLNGAIFKLTNTTPIYFYNVNVEDFEPDPDLEDQLGSDDVIDDDILDDMKKDEPTRVEAGDFTYSFYANDPETGEKAVIDNLPIGKYKLEEIQAPEGYKLSKTVKEIEIKYDNLTANVGKDSQTDIKFTNDRVTGKIILTKVSSSTGTTKPATDAQLVGAKFGLYAKNDIKDPANSSILYKAGDLISKKTVGNGTVGDDGIKTILTEDAQIIWNNLALGTYELKELEAPIGYKLNNSAIEINLNRRPEDTSSEIVADPKIVENEKTSILDIRKVISSGDDSEVFKPEKGIHFIVVANKYVEKYGSIDEAWKHREEFDAKDVESAEIVTDEDGNASTPELAWGEYKLKQHSSGVGTVDLKGVYSVTLKPNGDKVEHYQYTIGNVKYKSNVKLVKKDLKTGKNVSLNGATFKIFDEDKNEYVTQQVGPFKYDMFTTNSDNFVAIKGIWSNIDDILGTTMAPLKLSYGHYRVEEIKTPQGYLELDEPVRFEVSKDQNIFEVTGDNENPVIEVVIKNDRPTGKIILNKTFEESTIDVGELNSKFKLTAVKDVIDPADGSIIYKAGDIVNVNDIEDGIYSIDENNQIVVDGLPLGLDGASYQLEEIETNDSYALLEKPVVFDFSIQDTKTKEYTVEKDVTNELIEIHTTATGDSGTHETQIGEKVTITDKVEHKGLRIGQEYTDIGRLMNPATGGPLLVNGQEVIVEKTFTATKPNEIVELTFILDASALAGTSTVVFEDLYKDDRLIAVHRDIHDEDQTVKFIDIHTTATVNEEKVIHFDPNTEKDKDITIIDTVEYQNLTKGKEYTIGGTIMNAVTVKPFVSNGKIATAEKTFIAEAENGKVDVEFKINSKDLIEGHDLVVFESLKDTTQKDDNNKPVIIATHNDINDKNQTIKVDKKVLLLTDIQVNKVDSRTMKPIISKDFEFTLYSDQECKNVLKTVHANTKDGTATFKDLTFGTYYIKETKAPLGYLLSKEVKKVDVNYQLDGVGEIHSFVYRNTLEPITVKTGDNTMIGVFVAVGLLSLGCLIVLKRREAK